MSQTNSGNPLKKLHESPKKIRHRFSILHQIKILITSLEKMEIHNRIQPNKKHTIQNEKIKITVPYL